MANRRAPTLVPATRIDRAILLLRGHKVLLDNELAALYGVTTKRLNEQVRRNRGRFPADFVFELTRQEHRVLRSQIATLEPGRGRHRKYLPLAFTEHGALMAASVLNSPLAVRVSIQVVRAFVRLRQVLASHAPLARKLEDLERKYDAQFRVVFDAVRELLEPSALPRKAPIGFRSSRGLRS